MSELQYVLGHQMMAPYEEARRILSACHAMGPACELLNEAYRKGEPLVSDEVYDQLLIPALRKEDPGHPFLTAVEPEPFDTNLPAVRHAHPMLSTQKAYTLDELERFINQVSLESERLGITVSAVQYRVTPKLDGIAAFDDGKRIVTRGDGLQGTDITKIIDQGVHFIGGRGLGRGELVVDQAFFAEHLGKGTEHDLDHPRNFVAGFVGADTLKAHHHIALEMGAIRFVPFSQLPDRKVFGGELVERWEGLYDDLTSASPYETDGLVVEVEDQHIRKSMGATSHHERAVIAIKRQGEAVRSTVTGVRLTTGRTGRIIPTLLIEPVVLSGATVRRATAHTAKNLSALGLGEGAVATFVRSGEVIPKIVDVVTPANEPMTVTHCPSCGSEAEEEGEHMVCPNTAGCSAQAESRLRHWFHTLGNVDLFGRETVAKLVDADITEIPAIYAMTEDDFASLGFGPGQSANLVAQLERSRTETVFDWRWLAAFGIRHLGRGDARKLLAEIPLDELEHVTADRIARIPGFGPKTSPAIAESLRGAWPTIRHMLNLRFSLESSVPDDGAKRVGPLAGKQIVFTGVMVHGKRKDMEAQAEGLGAAVQSSVNGQTSVLVIGEKAGSKLKKAEGINAKAGHPVIEILREDEYLESLR